MAAFDPDTATAAYMATLSPEAHARATAYTQGGHWLLLWGALVTIVAAAIILRAGLLERLRGWIQRRRSRPNLAVFLCAAAFLLLDFVIELPWSIYAHWWRERQYDLTHQPFAGWLGEGLLSTVISVVMFGVILIGIYALIRKAPRTWWLWSGGVAAVAILVIVLIAPVLIEPLFNRYTPAPPGPTRDAVVTLAKRAGVPSDKILIYDGSKQSDRYTANVSGLFGSARVAMSDTMFKQGADLAEVRGVVGHEMGHYARGHVLLFALGMSVLAVLMFFLVDRLFPWVSARVGSGLGLADPAAFPVIVMITAVLGLLATPLLNTLTRVQESDADHFSMEVAHEPDGLSKALVKTIAYRASSPSELEEILFYDHPSVERRVHRAMVWKAAHPDLVGK